MGGGLVEGRDCLCQFLIPHLPFFRVDERNLNKQAGTLKFDRFTVI